MHEESTEEIQWVANVVRVVVIAISIAAIADMRALINSFTDPNSR